MKIIKLIKTNIRSIFKFVRFQAPENNQSNTLLCARITVMIKTKAKPTVQIGPILKPWEESSKNLINPAPPEGIGAFPLLLFLRPVDLRGFAI